MKQSKLRPIYASVSIDSSTFVKKFDVHCLCYQLTANTTTCIVSDCGSIMSLKGYYALKCLGARFICGIIAIDGKYRNFELRFQRMFYYVIFFTAMTMKISSHLVSS